LLVGALANHHPQAATIRALASFIAKLSDSHIIVLPTANSNAMSLAGAPPYQEDEKQTGIGLNCHEIWQQKLKAYVLFGIEAEFDTADPAQAQDALNDANFVVTINSFVSDAMLASSDVILPLASFVETSGTFIGVDKQWQSFSGAVAPKGESRPGWKILRVLANIAKITDIDFVSSQDVREEVKDNLNLKTTIKQDQYIPESLITETALMAISEVPMYQIDALVRRSEALQQTPDNLKSKVARMNSNEATRYGLNDKNTVTVSQGENSMNVAFERDETIAEGCIYLATGSNEASQLGAAYGEITVTALETVDT